MFFFSRWLIVDGGHFGGRWGKVLFCGGRPCVCFSCVLSGLCLSFVFGLVLKFVLCFNTIICVSSWRFFSVSRECPVCALVCRVDIFPD